MNLYDTEVIHALQYYYNCTVKQAKKLVDSKPREFLIDCLLSYRKDMTDNFYND